MLPTDPTTLIAAPEVDPTAISCHRELHEATENKTKALHVIVIGGRVAGLTAAHELSDRGVTVTVYERRQD